jgi:hypothetical protein
MNISQKAFLCCLFCLAAIPVQAGFIFIPIPGKVTTAKPGQLCVGADTAPGDIKKAMNGDVVTIKAVLGKSPFCKKAESPVLADTEYSASTFSANAGMNLPEGYKAETLTEMQKFNGILLLAGNKSAGSFVKLQAIKREHVADLDTFVAQLKVNQSKAIKVTSQSDTETLLVNGLPARRFITAGGPLKGFGPNVTYLETIMASADEVIGVSAWTRTSNFEKLGVEMKHMAESIVGINPPQATNPDAN